MKALIVIDYTNDFVASDGALTCGEPGQIIEKAIHGLVEMFVQNEDAVVLATDRHEINDTYHPESALFPPHNIVGSQGRDFYGSLAKQHEKYQLFVLDKRRYSAFAGTGLDIYLRERGIQEVHLCGVCTDICVLHTAVDAYNLGYKIVIHEQAVASFDEQGHQYALRHFEKVMGAQIERG